MFKLSKKMTERDFSCVTSDLAVTSLMFGPHVICNTPMKMSLACYFILHKIQLKLI